MAWNDCSEACSRARLLAFSRRSACLSFCSIIMLIIFIGSRPLLLLLRGVERPLSGPSLRLPSESACATIAAPVSNETWCCCCGKLGRC